MSVEFSMYMTKAGENGVYLGDYSLADTELLSQFFNEYGIERFHDNSVEEAVANPSQAEINIKTLKNALNAPHEALSRAILPKTITLGPYKDAALDWTKGISVEEASTISLRVAALNLAIFIPPARKKMGLYLLQQLNRNHEITEEDIRHYDLLKPKDRGGSASETLEGLVVSTLLRGNTKMVKTKIPSSLNIGTPVDKDLNEAPVAGSVGLQFLPNNTLIANSRHTGQKGFLQIIKNLRPPTAIWKDGKERLILENTKFFTVKTLKGVQGATCCAHASNGCKMVCLADAGQRYATPDDFFGITERKQGKTTKKTPLDERTGRLILGFTQTAFLANPVAFLRVLIEACLQHALTHQTEVYRHIMEVAARGGEVDFSYPEYLEAIPPSVRLNVFSDYPWELIYPDLFELFDGNTRFSDEGVYPRVQFYDYTKIPGRWTEEARQHSLQLIADKQQRHSSGKTAVIIKGNSYYATTSDRENYEKYYGEVADILEGAGYTVSFFESEDYTTPPDADLWVAHSRGAGMYAFVHAPSEIQKLTLDDYETGAKEYQKKLAKEMKRRGYSSIREFPVEERPRPGAGHYTVTPSMRKALENTRTSTSFSPYHLPENYHITFSYSGAQISKKYSDICSAVGQNTTYVFYTVEIGDEVLDKLFPEDHPKAKKFMNQFRKLIRRLAKNKAGSATKATTRASLLPPTYEGVTVLDGDNYDLRFLDDEVGEGPFVIGLAWKNPQGFKISIDGGKSMVLNPVRAASEHTEFIGDVIPKGARVETGAGFGVVRYGLGTQFFDDTRVYFIRKGVPSAESIRGVIEAFGDAQVTFATETGNSINTLDDATQLQLDIFEELKNQLPLASEFSLG